MKLHNILIFAIIFSTIYSCNSQNQKSSMEDIYIGMTIDQFNKIIPNAKVTNPGQNQVCSKEETLSNIKGEWGWHFKDSKLNWVLYDKYDENVNETNFNKYLKSSKEIISQYKSIYGEPIKYEEKNMKFKDDWLGYDVISAVWKTDKMKIRLEFIVMGGKSPLMFLLKIEYQNVDYEYF
ncbi:MAG: hypothetical protein K8R54_07355 [Bacteroidales bacterium]|nr:hypothetical protein [Bacteroidales bacterium]